MWYILCIDVNFWISNCDMRKRDLKNWQFSYLAHEMMALGKSSHTLSKTVVGFSKRKVVVGGRKSW